jgi:hypothetical protein
MKYPTYILVAGLSLMDLMWKCYGQKFAQTCRDMHLTIVPGVQGYAELFGTCNRLDGGAADETSVRISMAVGVDDGRLIWKRL